MRAKTSIDSESLYTYFPFVQKQFPCLFNCLWSISEGGEKKELLRNFPKFSVFLSTLMMPLVVFSLKTTRLMYTNFFNLCQERQSIFPRDFFRVHLLKPFKSGHFSFPSNYSNITSLFIFGVLPLFFLLFFIQPVFAFLIVSYFFSILYSSPTFSPNLLH